MKIKRLSSKGIAHIGLIFLIIIVIGIVAFAGWFVWHQHKGGETAQSGLTARNDQQGGTGTTEPHQTSDLKESGKYLVIKEWGVWMPLSDDISEAYYKIRSEKLADYVALYDASFDRLHNTGGISCGGSNVYQFYSISRAKPENVPALRESGGSVYQEFPFTREYLFSGVGPYQAPPACSDLNTDPGGEYRADENILNIADNKERLFGDAFKRLQQ